MQWNGSWAESGDDGSATSQNGDAFISNGYLHMDNYFGGSLPAVRRGVNLAGATTAVLEFDVNAYGAQSLDVALVELSTNGGSSYTTVQTITVIGSVNRSYNVDLAAVAGLTADTVIRFRSARRFRCQQPVHTFRQR